MRRRHEQQTPSRPEDNTDEAIWQDVRPILDEEIQRLPEKYRLPIILCYLEGQTNDEAAKILRCPRGTVATRLARARERLRSRLLRRGVTLSAAALAAAKLTMPCQRPFRRCFSGRRRRPSCSARRRFRSPR